MKPINKSIAAVFLIIFGLTGCKHNPIDRLLGTEKPSPDNTPVPVASSGLTLIVMTPRVTLGDNAVFGVINLTDHPITTSVGPSQFLIISRAGEPVNRTVSTNLQQVRFQSGDYWTDSWTTESTGQYEPRSGQPSYYVSWGDQTRDFSVDQ